MNLEAIGQSLSAALGESIELIRFEAVSGGCIHQTGKIIAHDGRVFFLKADTLPRLPVFQAEAHSLRVLNAAACIRVPRPLCHGQDEASAFLVMEYISMRSRGDDRRRGEQLAALHRQSAPAFGWEADNFIGPTPQQNAWTQNWVDFYRDNRLIPQTQLARKNGISIRKMDTLLESLPSFFSGYTPQSSLLHGDLWGGNAAFDEEGNPLLFDPASYYGDREADLALTELFGGFSRAFYEGYVETWPLDSGYRLRRDLYNLYHVLNHFNLFGGGYGSQAESMVDQLLSQI